MKIDLSVAQIVSPSSAEVQVSTAPLGSGIDVNSALIAAPTVALALPLDPLSGAGVELTRWVLAILAGVLLIILSAVVWEQHMFNSVTAAAYQSMSGKDHGTGSLEKLSPEALSTLASAKKTLDEIADKDTKTKRDSLQKLVEQVEEVALKSNDGRTRDALEKLARSIKTLQGTTAGLDVPSTAIKSVSKTVAKLIEGRSRLGPLEDQLAAEKELLAAYVSAAKSTRDFWVQIAQMILINLLLPVLTALLGYVFASKSNKA